MNWTARTNLTDCSLHLTIPQQESLIIANVYRWNKQDDFVLTISSLPNGREHAILLYSFKGKSPKELMKIAEEQIGDL